MEKRKVNVYIDGFNLYHALCKTWKKSFKWINLKKLSENYINKEYQALWKVYFFTAYPKWNTEKTKRHKLYVNALMSVWVKIRNWKFSKVSRTFIKNKNKVLKILFDNSFINFIKKQFWEKIYPSFLEYSTHEEKRTDVNMVLQIFEDAVKNNYDDAIIISWDSDMIPVIKSVKNTIKWKKFISVLPFRWKWREIKKACDESKIMYLEHLESSILPKTIQFNSLTINSPYIDE